ncbi:hypothetical protein D5086_002357 [Populus alba]|uniref:Uncharacterized protein n=1 Tax=Populus alba TaxID=43335 RepID=A0ACC4D2I2_POPAL
MGIHRYGIDINDDSYIGGGIAVIALVSLIALAGHDFKGAVLSGEGSGLLASSVAGLRSWSVELLMLKLVVVLLRYYGYR